MDAPLVLVSLPDPRASRALAERLAELRPGWRVQVVAPAELEAALAAEPGSVAVTDEPSAAVQDTARAWVAWRPSGRDVALVGGGDRWRTLRHPALEAVAAGIEGVLPPSPSPLTGELGS